MREKEKIEGMLSPYRVLDLTDEKGLFCGKLLGDLGADVIKIEKPGGDPTRNIGPFYHDEPDREKSLFWFAFNTSKRGVTLDIETADGQEVFKRLVASADFVIESFPPGYMDKLGLGYSDLEKINAGIIMVSIAPFGQTGPHRDYKAPDIVAWAMGGQMYSWGNADRSPLRLSHPCQTYLHAAAEGAVGAIMALHYRHITGEGQHVDVSIQESIVQLTYQVTNTWDLNKAFQRREGNVLLPSTSKLRIKRTWACKDGHLYWHFFTGQRARKRNEPLIEWMDSEGMANDFLKGLDWDTFDFATITQDIVDRLEEPTARFFLSHTKKELLNGALEKDITLLPVSTTRDILENVQLAARGFLVEVEHPELGTTITYPGAFCQSSVAPPRVSRRAPLIGEHNKEILGNEAGFISRDCATVKQSAVLHNQRQKETGKILPQKLLEGIKVVDFTQVFAGPLTTKYLADYGAEVLKIEGTTRHDTARLTHPQKDDIVGVNRGGSFSQYNTGKLSVTLNLARPKGLEIIKKFIARSDIVVENFAGGAIARMGLGYEELKKIKPDIIMLSSCMMGQTGPQSTYPGYGPHMTALSGFNSIAGWPDRTPIFIGAYTDYVAPHFHILAIMAALDYRRQTGKGQYLDFSQYENGVHFMAPLLQDDAVNHRIADRMGNRAPDAAPHGAYCCRGEDRWCVIAVFTSEEWESFCRVIGNPAWSKDSRFNTLTVRKENEDELDKLVEGWTINRPAEEVMKKMQAEGVPAGAVENGEDLLEHDPQLKHRRFFWELEHPEIGKYRAPGHAFLLSKSPCELRRASLLGEHTEYVLKEILGMSADEIASLAIEGVV